MQRRLIVILGPTASGKSALGVKLAKKFHGVVISADSRQVYRGLDIGTAKISRREMRGVPHYLLDVTSPRSQYSVARYVRDVRRVLKNISPSTPIFLVGGSPFYLQAVTQPGSWSAVPPDQLLRRRLAAQSTRQLFNQLTKLNPSRAKTIDPANRRRLIRAIEISSSAPHLSAWGSGGVGAGVLKIGLPVPRRELFRRIDHHVDQRLRRGMIKEVVRLNRRGVPWSRLTGLGLEYREIVRTLRHQASAEDLPARMKTATHDFARRQMTWWKRDRSIRWVTRPAEAERLVRRFLATG